MVVYYDGKQEKNSESYAAKTLGLIVITIAVAFLVPVSMPLIGILFLVTGVIFSRRSIDPNERIFWRIVMGVGIILILLTLFILLFNRTVR